jgi:hypothetical protein
VYNERVFKDRQKTLNIVNIAVAAVLFVALIVSAAVLPNIGAKPAGSLGGDFLDGFIFHYSVETRFQFSENLNEFLNKAVPFAPPVANFNAIIEALQLARISAGKAIKFSEYFKNLRFDERTLDDCTDMFNCPSDACHCPNLSFLDYFNLQELISYSGITTGELGRFIFEHQLLVLRHESGELNEQGKLLNELGRERFNWLFTDPFDIYAEFAGAVERGNLTLADGRMIRAILYTQGARFDEILVNFGAENIEKLLGIGADLNLALNLGQNWLLNRFSHEFEGITSYALRTFADASMSMHDNPQAFDALVNYVNNGGEDNRVAAILPFATAFAAAHQNYLTQNDVNKNEFIEKIASVFACVFAFNLSVEQGGNTMAEAQEDFNRLKSEELKHVTRLFELLDKNLEEAEDVAKYINELVDLLNKFENGLEQASAMLLSIFFLRAIL